MVAITAVIRRDPTAGTYEVELSDAEIRGRFPIGKGETPQLRKIALSKFRV